ncbi:anaerobic ribonucleoside-triphosphate reductase activating protein [Ruminococcaceae bacterium OttesenSCG-928-O06]|nr:anaerobic ribonucleoside-triphosphate reductase activating protein [Ruminococcaceae bacterium OttesenSCG-928-O06]
MNLQGLQKLSLLDFPEKVCCTFFTGGCNWRCPFCHNTALIPAGTPPQIPPEEALAFLRGRKGLLDGVCISGGEPTLQPDLEDFLAEVKALGFAVKLDTNGSFPARLRALVQAQLVDYVAMDIKSSRAGYAAAAGVPGMPLAAVEESAAFLLKGAIDYEFRTTVLHPLHTMADFADIAAWLAGAKRYFLQAYRPPPEGDVPGFSAFTPAEMQAAAEALCAAIPAVALRGL